MGLFKIIYHFMQFYIKKLRRFVFLDLGTFTANMMDLGTFSLNEWTLLFFQHSLQYRNSPKGIVSASAT